MIQQRREHIVKKAISSDSDSPGAPHQIEIPAITTAAFEAMISAHRRMFEHIEATNRIWLAAVQEVHCTGADLSARLVKCSNPAEGATLCNEWIRERATRFASDSQQAAQLWMGFYGSALAASGAAADLHRKGEEGGSEREKHPSPKAA
jgi:hypothetical protein